jgi:hypothetical protein
MRSIRMDSVLPIDQNSDAWNGPFQEDAGVSMHGAGEEG